MTWWFRFTGTCLTSWNTSSNNIRGGSYNTGSGKHNRTTILDAITLLTLCSAAEQIVLVAETVTSGMMPNNSAMNLPQLHSVNAMPSLHELSLFDSLLLDGAAGFMQNNCFNFIASAVNCFLPCLAIILRPFIPNQDKNCHKLPGWTWFKAMKKTVYYFR